MDIATVKEYLKSYDGPQCTIMEVCGTHTATISQNGIPDMLSDKIRLISGPGCPVCVTVAAYIDRLLELALTQNTTVVTFGDMIRVRGTKLSLSDASAMGASVKTVYSPFEIIELAKADTGRNFVFAAVGFETTAPVYALIIERLINDNIKNVKLLTAIKTMPEAIRTVFAKNGKITGFLAPGHVSIITGYELFLDLAKKLQVPFVVSGFSGEELLLSVYALTKLKGGQALNMYTSVVTTEGNERAKEKLLKYFKITDAPWRGMGIIKNSGMVLKEEYGEFDAGSQNLISDSMYNSACKCADVISGMLSPCECPLFGGVCTPENPQGACMVSAKGACFHHYVNKRL